MDGSGRSPFNRTQESNAMAQQLPTDFPIDPVTTSGTALAEILNRMNEANNSNNAGATPPAATFPGMMWLDTSVSPTVVRIRNAGNTGWDTVATSNTPMMLPNGTANSPSLAFVNEPGLGMYRPGASTTGFTGNVSMLGVLDVQGLSVSSNKFIIRGQNFGFYNGGAGGIFAFDPNNYWDWSNVSGQLLWRGQLVTIPALASTSFTSTRVTVGNQALYASGPHSVFAMLEGAQWYWLCDGGTGDLTWQRSPGAGNVPTTFMSNGDFYAGGRRIATRWNGHAGGMMMLDNGGTNNALWFTMDGWRWQCNNGDMDWMNSSGTTLFKFGTNGQGYQFSGSASWGPISDIRLKSNVAPMEYGLDEILRLEPITYDLPNGVTGVAGLSAQSVHDVMPAAGKTVKNVYPDSDLEDVLSYDPDFVHLSCVNAIKTLHRRITQLENAT
jgi:hypothetical protein